MLDPLIQFVREHMVAIITVIIAIAAAVFFLSMSAMSRSRDKSRKANDTLRMAQSALEAEKRAASQAQAKADALQRPAARPLEDVKDTLRNAPEKLILKDLEDIAYSNAIYYTPVISFEDNSLPLYCVMRRLEKSGESEFDDFTMRLFDGEAAEIRDFTIELARQLFENARRDFAGNTSDATRFVLELPREVLEGASGIDEIAQLLGSHSALARTIVFLVDAATYAALEPAAKKTLTDMMQSGVELALRAKDAKQMISIAEQSATPFAVFLDIRTISVTDQALWDAINSLQSVGTWLVATNLVTESDVADAAGMGFTHGCGDGILPPKRLRNS